MNETDMSSMQRPEQQSHMALIDSRGPSRWMSSLIWGSQHSICFTHYYCSLRFTGFPLRWPEAGALQEEPSLFLFSSAPCPGSHLATGTKFGIKMNTVVRKPLRWPLSVSIKQSLTINCLTFPFTQTLWPQCSGRAPFFPEVSCHSTNWTLAWTWTLLELNKNGEITALEINLWSERYGVKCWDAIKKHTGEIFLTSGSGFL